MISIKIFGICTGNYRVSRIYKGFVDILPDSIKPWAFSFPYSDFISSRVSYPAACSVLKKNSGWEPPLLAVGGSMKYPAQGCGVLATVSGRL